jgi:hypothetical protein
MGRRGGSPPWDRSREPWKEFGKKPPMEKHKGARIQIRQDRPFPDGGDKLPSFDAVQRIVSILDDEQKKQWHTLIGQPFTFKKEFDFGPFGHRGGPDRP